MLKIALVNFISNWQFGQCWLAGISVGPRVINKKIFTQHESLILGTYAKTSHNLVCDF